MSTRMQLFHHETFRSRTIVASTLLAALVLLAGACVPPPSGGGGTTTTTEPVTWTPGPCPDSSGVTVVVDFAELDAGEVAVRCALGAQPSGIAALASAGFVTSSESGPGTICTIDALPAEGYPYCWLTGGYWSYWRAPVQGDPWVMASTGPGAGPLAQGSVHGFAWAQGFASDGPSVGSDGTP